MKSLLVVQEETSEVGKVEPSVLILTMQTYAVGYRVRWLEGLQARYVRPHIRLSVMVKYKSV
jgi:hypothetical protein